jgi:hypothetical protein
MNLTRRLATALASATAALFFAASAYASLISNGPNGIDAIATGLTGAGIGIGQVETGRPGQPGFDDGAHSNVNVIPAGVFEQNFNATANRGTDNHASRVASAMISHGAASVGTSPTAALYSSADTGPDLVSSAMSAGSLARINGVRAINHSFGITQGAAGLTGTSLYTSFIDWSASRYDVLHVISGNEQGGSLNAKIPKLWL